MKKIPFIQCLYGIKSMRQTIKDIEVNVAYRWFLGLEMYDSVPHFSTFGKNYTRRFKDTDLFEQIFAKIQINDDREKRGKKPLKEKDDSGDNDDNTPSSGGTSGSTKEIKESTTDSESGWFHKGEHKQVFAYSLKGLH